MILERDKEQRVLRSRATQVMSDVVAAQKNPGPWGSPIFKLLRRCSSVMCHRHITFLVPCTDFKSGTPNSQFNFLATPNVFLHLYSEFDKIYQRIKKGVKMVKIDPNKPLYSIGTVAELIGTHPRTLRVYEENGIIIPQRTESNRRLYSLKDIEKLEYIHYLAYIKRVNIRGIKVILQLLEEIRPELRQKIINKTEAEIKNLDKEKKKIFVEGKEEIKKEILSD